MELTNKSPTSFDVDGIMLDPKSLPVIWDKGGKRYVWNEIPLAQCKQLQKARAAKEKKVLVAA